MSNLVVQLPADAAQSYRGFSDTHPLVAHSVATHPPAAVDGGESAVQKWLGVPFATAQRWAKPVTYAATAASKGDDAAVAIVDAFEYGAVPWQPPGIVEKHWVTRKGWLNRDFVGMSEDCLSCNVFVPEAARAKGDKIPVLVWCYGGALNTGHAAAVRHDATELVRLSEKEGRPVIVVTGNYRVNIFGFMNHEDLQSDDADGTSGNYGFYDQISLFSWVKSNISAFGGDDANITAFGESAGAFSISVLAARQIAPNSPSLFKRAILQSGSPSTMKCHPSTRSYVGYPELLKTYDLDSPNLSAVERIAGLRKIPAKDLMDFAARVGGGWGGTIQAGNPKSLWEKDPEAKFREGLFDQSIEEWVLGTNRDEGTLFTAAFNIGSPVGLESWISRFPTAQAARLRELYSYNGLDSSSPISLVDDPASFLLADQLFLAPLHTLATSIASVASAPSIKTFSFHAELPQMSGHLGMGAHHGEEIPFVFGTRTFWQAGSDEEKTSEECMRRWSSLATDGKGAGTGPEWLAYTPTVPNQLIIGPGGGETRSEVLVRSELDQKRLEFWIDTIADVQVSTAL